MAEGQVYASLVMKQDGTADTKEVVELCKTKTDCGQVSIQNAEVCEVTDNFCRKMCKKHLFSYESSDSCVLACFCFVIHFSND